MQWHDPAQWVLSDIAAWASLSPQKCFTNRDEKPWTDNRVFAVCGILRIASQRCRHGFTNYATAFCWDLRPQRSIYTKTKFETWSRGATKGHWVLMYIYVGDYSEEGALSWKPPEISSDVRRSGMWLWMLRANQRAAGSWRISNKQCLEWTCIHYYRKTYFRDQGNRHPTYITQKHSKIKSHPSSIDYLLQYHSLFCFKPTNSPSPKDTSVHPESSHTADLSVNWLG